MARTRAQENRAIRQDALREQLANKGLMQHVLELSNKINELDPSDDTSEFNMRKYKTTAELQLKLVAKYLPDLRSTELTGEGGGDLEITGIALERVTAKSTDS